MFSSHFASQIISLLIGFKDKEEDKEKSKLVKTLTRIKRQGQGPWVYSAGDVVRGELDNYPYARRAGLKEPHFRPLDLAGQNELFRAAVTDAGVCQVYNGNSLISTYEQSDRIKDLQYSFDPRTDDERYQPNMIEGTGKISQMTFWLDAQDKSKFNSDSFQKNRGNLAVAINEWGKFFDVRLNQIELRAGTEAIIKIEPVVHESTGPFGGLSIESRKCRFHHEIKDEDSMFREYTEEGCLFECKLRKAANYSQCIPWDYPVPNGLEDMDICTTYDMFDDTKTLKGFEMEMNKPTSPETCGCLPGCNVVNYKTQVDTLDLDVDKLCGSSKDMFSDSIKRVMKDWELTNSPLWTYWGNLMRDDSQFGEKYVIPEDREKKHCPGGDTTNCHQRGTFYYHLPEDEVKSVCKSRYKNDVVKLTLQIAQPTVVKIEKDVSASFTDIIGVVGGTLGLFTGLSLISIVEAVYWMLKVLASFLKQ